MKPWQMYEAQITERLRRKAEPEADVRANQNVPGKLSGIDRQVDVLVTGLFGGLVRARMAVDCKCWSTHVDVADVEQFIGLVEDIGVEMGLLITTSGYSDAAIQRAKSARGVFVEVVPFEELDEWEPPFEICRECGLAAIEDEKMPGGVWFERADDPRAKGVGECDRCFTVYAWCECSAITSLWTENEWIECEGCDLKWLLEPDEYDHDRIPTKHLSERLRSQGEA
jgi:hypothetical protein